MATYLKRGTRITAWVRKGGHQRSQTFDSKTDARTWAEAIEKQIEELRASGVMRATGMTLADLIDRYVKELYPVKPWGRTKAADLARMKKDLGPLAVSDITSHHITNYFRKRHESGAGVVVLHSQLCYLTGVFECARQLWHLDVPLQAVKDARAALTKIRLVGKSKRRERRVTDTELAKIIEHMETWTTGIALGNVLRFCVATGMRISEVCRLRWADLNEGERVILVRDRKHPSEKIGNDMVVPLLAFTGHDAFALIQAQRPPKGEPLPTRIFPYNPKTVSSYFTLAVEETGLDDVHLHDLRHEALSRFFEAGLRIEQVALISGHRDWAQLKRYVHLRAVDLHEHVPPKKRARKVAA